MIFWGMHQCTISSMHGSRKVVCYLMMPFVVGLETHRRGVTVKKHFGENGNKLRKYLYRR